MYKIVASNVKNYYSLESIFVDQTMCAKAKKIIEGSKSLVGSFENESIKTLTGKQQVMVGLQYIINSSKLSPTNMPDSFLKLLLKSIQILGHTLPRLQRDLQIPEPFKNRVTQKNVLHFIVDLVKAKVSEPFPNFSKKLIIYNKAVQKISDHLYQSKDPRAHHWKPRGETLFLWCRVLIERTTHPVLQLLKRIPENKFKMKSDYQKLNQYMNDMYQVMTNMVYFLVPLDDVADDLQDPKLLDIFSQVPFASNEKRVHIRKIVENKYSAYLEFFQIYENAWDESYQSLQRLVSPSIFDEYKPRFQEMIDKVIDSMRISLEMNQSPERFFHQIDQIEDGLAVNMLMTVYKVIESMVIDDMLVDTTKAKWNHLSPYLSPNESIQEVFRLGEVIGHSGNNVATLVRELRQCDISNTLAFIIHEELRLFLGHTCTPFPEYIQDKCSSFPMEHLNDCNGFIPFLLQFKELDQTLTSLLHDIQLKLPKTKDHNFERIAIFLQSIQDQELEVNQEKIDTICRYIEHHSQYIRAIDAILEDTTFLGMGNSEKAIIEYYHERMVYRLKRISSLINTAERLPGFSTLQKSYDILGSPISMTGMARGYVNGVIDLYNGYLLFKSDM